jgi:nucleoside-diphosphate-sugar epimerase
MGENVTLLDLDFNSNTQFLNCAKVRGNVLDYDSVREIVNGKDAVFHFAAVSRVAWGQKDPYKCWQTNQLGTVNVLEACRKAQSGPVMFYASSREVYGEPTYFPVNESHPKNPISIYGITKLCAEGACHSYSSTSGLSQAVNQVIFRFSNVYGSTRDLPSRVIPKFMMSALRGEDIALYGGDQVLDFTFIDDTVSGILKAYTASLDSNRELFGEDFHFVTGRGVSVAELAKMIVNIVGSSSKITATDANGFEVRKFIGDPRKSQELLGYEPRVRLEDGLRILSERIAPSIQAR